MALDPNSRGTAVVTAAAMAFVSQRCSRSSLPAPDVARRGTAESSGRRLRRRRRVRPLRAVHRPFGRLHDPDRQRVCGARLDLGRSAVPGGRHAGRPRPWVRRPGGRGRPALQAHCRVMRSPARTRAVLVRICALWRGGDGVGVAFAGENPPPRCFRSHPESVRPLPRPAEPDGPDRRRLRVLLQDVLRDPGEGDAAHRRMAAGRAGLHRPVRLPATSTNCALNIEVAAWALLTLVFTISAVRYYASGLTSAGLL